MAFFHVQSVEDEYVDCFVPRIPKTRLILEDDVIPRICLSDSIQGALKGSQYLLQKRDETSVFRQGVKGIYLRVYSFRDVSLKELVTPEELVEDGLVQDAMFTREHWYLQNLKPSDCFYIFVEYPVLADEKQFFTEFYRFDFVEESEINEGLCV